MTAAMKMIWIPQLIASTLLLWALNPENPYGYYILLRWICCAIFAYLAIQAHSIKREGWVWILGTTAAIYNPVIPTHLTRGIWSVVNLATIVVAASSVVALRRPADMCHESGKGNTEATIKETEAKQKASEG